MNRSFFIILFFLLIIIVFIEFFDLKEPLSYLLIILSVFLIWSLWFKQIKKETEDLKDFLTHLLRNDFSIEGSPSIIDSDGIMAELRGTIRAFTDALEKRIKKLKKEKETSESIIKNMKEGLLIAHVDNRILFINDSLVELLGANLSKDSTATEILREAELINMIEDSRSAKKAISREVTLRDGRALSVTALPIELSGKEEGIMMTFYDITRLKRLEEMRRDFVANVAHEIKTPITAIKGFAETLLDGALEDRENTVRFLEIIKRHSERLNSLVSDLLTLSAIEQGEVKLNVNEVNISEVIDSVFSLMEKKAKSKGLYLKKDLPDNNLIRADRDRLFQILLNLVDNGIKFTDYGGVTVGMERSDEKISIYVNDTGCGIEKKHLSRLGERFYRVDRARSRELGGTGLGLAIVKHLVKAHGWDMKIDSTPGKGTRVNIIVN